MTLVIFGRSGSGKTTAVRRLLGLYTGTLYGLWTEKLPAPAGENAPVYMHSFRQPIRYGAENLIGNCRDHRATAIPETFETFGTEILRAIPDGGFVVLDEIGIMERNSPAFCEEVLRTMRRCRTVVTVRDIEDPFLLQIRSFPGALTVSAEEANAPGFASHAAEMLF